MHQSPARRLFIALVKWAFSIGMLAYVLHAIDAAQVRQMLMSQNPLVPAAVISLLIVQMAISTFRWQRLLRTLSGGHVRYRALFSLNFISVFFNSCLPGTIGGDMVRAVLLKAEKVPLTLCFHSVIIDRLLAVAGIALIVLASLPWLGKLLPALPAWDIFISSIIALAGSIYILRKLPATLSRLPSTHVLRVAIHLLESVSATLGARGQLFILLAQAVLAHLCFCAAAWLLGASIGIEVGFSYYVLLIPPVLFAMMLPISVGGWGVREVSMVGLLALAGVSKEAALTISVQLGILSIIASLPGAWCYLKRRAISGSASRQS